MRNKYYSVKLKLEISSSVPVAFESKDLQNKTSNPAIPPILINVNLDFLAHHDTKQSDRKAGMKAIFEAF